MVRRTLMNEDICMGDKTKLRCVVSRGVEAHLELILLVME